MLICRLCHASGLIDGSQNAVWPLALEVTSLLKVYVNWDASFQVLQVLSRPTNRR